MNPALIRDTVPAVTVLRYRLVVGVLSILFDEDAALEAKRQFDLFVIQAKHAEFAGNGTSVTLFRNHEIIAEFHPAASDFADRLADHETSTPMP
jgi:hypothetical protein